MTDPIESAPKGTAGRTALRTTAPLHVESVLAWGLRPEQPVFKVFLDDGRVPILGRCETYWAAYARCALALSICPDASLTIKAPVKDAPTDEDQLCVWMDGDMRTHSGRFARFRIDHDCPAGCEWVLPFSTTGMLEVAIGCLACVRVLLPQREWTVYDYDAEKHVDCPRAAWRP